MRSTTDAPAPTPNTHTIAAWLAKHTPMQYHSPLSLAFEQAERELGERIGYPALVYDGNEEMSNPITTWRDVVFLGTSDIEGKTLYEALIDYSNEADTHDPDEVCSCIYCQQWTPMAHKIERASAAKDATIAALRAELATAHEMVGATIAHLEAICDYATNPAAVNALGMTPDERLGGVWSQSEASLSAARAWLRKEAGR